jgi:hypothetical protein
VDIKKHNTMKIIASILAISILMAFAGDKEQLPIGTKAPMPDYEMVDVSGKTYTLNSLAKKNGLLVIFSCNTCPFVIGWEDQYPMLGTTAERADIGMVLVNSNEAKRPGDDSMEEMKKHFTKKPDTTHPMLLMKTRSWPMHFWPILHPMFTFLMAT